MNIPFARVPKCLFLFLALAFAPTIARAQSDLHPHAKVSLLSKGDSLLPNHDVWIGLLFDLEKGWHIYWVNPGDSGAALRVRWTVPRDFKTGEIHWPVPSRVGKGELTDFGYEGQVLLPLQLRIPRTYRPGSAVRIAAAVQYAVCQGLVCKIEETQTGLSIPPAHSRSFSAGGIEKLFQDALDHEPKPMPPNWRAHEFDDGRNFVLTLETGAKIMNAQFFPLVPNQIDNAAPQTITPTAHGVQITIKKSADLVLAVRPLNTLKGVVVLGSGEAYAVEAALAP